MCFKLRCASAPHSIHQTNRGSYHVPHSATCSKALQCQRKALCGRQQSWYLEVVVHAAVPVFNFEVENPEFDGGVVVSLQVTLAVHVVWVVERIVGTDEER